MTNPPFNLRIGILSDTHGLLRQEVLDALEGADHILHAGDIGDAEILSRLRRIAPVTAIRGNIDTRPPLSTLPATEMVELGSLLFYLVHAIEDLDLDPSATGIHVIVFGHSHKAEIRRDKGILFLNPGSAGPRRFRLPASLAIATVSNGQLSVEMITIAS